MNKTTKFNQNIHKKLSSRRPAGSIMLAFLLVSSLFLTSCRTSSGAAGQTALSPSSTAKDKAVMGVIKVKGGAMLERDIIPQICEVYSLSEQEVKATLSTVRPSTLINAQLTDFRRMEGIILPGEYRITEGSELKKTVEDWVVASEKRYNKFLASDTNPNNLKPYEQLALASMVEAECLASTHQEEVATVFLNRLEAGAKLQSCVTAEYAIGYQRPYLTSDDVKKVSNYNTYYVKGLPVGPICVISDASLQVAMKKKKEGNIYYFYYDYIINNMFFFSDYTKFKQEGEVSKQRFKENSPVDLRAKINKQNLYH